MDVDDLAYRKKIHRLGGRKRVWGFSIFYLRFAIFYFPFSIQGPGLIQEGEKQK